MNDFKDLSLIDDDIDDDIDDTYGISIDDLLRRDSLIYDDLLF